MCLKEHISGEAVKNSGSETRRIYGGVSEGSNVGEERCSGAKCTRESTGESIPGELFARSNDDGERKAATGGNSGPAARLTADAHLSLALLIRWSQAPCRLPRGFKII